MPRLRIRFEPLPPSFFKGAKFFGIELGVFTRNDVRSNRYHKKAHPCMRSLTHHGPRPRSAYGQALGGHARLPVCSLTRNLVSSVYKKYLKANDNFSSAVFGRWALGSAFAGGRSKKRVFLTVHKTLFFESVWLDKYSLRNSIVSD